MDKNSGKKTNLSKIALGLFVKTTAATETFLDFTYHPHHFVYKSLNEDFNAKETSIKSALFRLEKRKLLEKQTAKNGEILYKLTADGEVYVLKDKLKSTQIKERRGGLIVVVFDIPEQARVVRNLLRSQLKDFGFSMLQKSVWVSKKDYFELLKKYLNLTSLGDYVILFESYQVYVGKKS